MEQLIAKMLDQVAGQGLPMAFTIVAVWFLYQTNKGLIVRLNDERNEHMTTLGDQIKDLREAVMECERDRKELWAKILQQSN
ncbi:MAG: hypothetical protein EB015_20620 [Methylocystaceae bacterium]|nr:hypothetical protein [Methylocystaceae bacterium]